MRCCGRASPRRNDKDLPWINQVGIANLLPVRLVNDSVARAHAVVEVANAPEAVAAGDGGGRDLRHEHSGGRASVERNVGHCRRKSVANVERHLGACAHRTGNRLNLVQPDAVAAGYNPFVDRDRKTSIRPAFTELTKLSFR
jgi:hypothetical protein